MADETDNPPEAPTATMYSWRPPIRIVDRENSPEAIILNALRQDLFGDGVKGLFLIPAKGEFFKVPDRELSFIHGENAFMRTIPLPSAFKELHLSTESIIEQCCGIMREMVGEETPLAIYNAGGVIMVSINGEGYDAMTAKLGVIASTYNGKGNIVDLGKLRNTATPSTLPRTP